MNDLDKLIFISDNIEPKKRDSDLMMAISSKGYGMDDVIKIIIKRKKERASVQEREVNPLFDAMLEDL